MDHNEGSDIAKLTYLRSSIVSTLLVPHSELCLTRELVAVGELVSHWYIELEDIGKQCVDLPCSSTRCNAVMRLERKQFIAESDEV